MGIFLHSVGKGVFDAVYSGDEIDKCETLNSYLKWVVCWILCRTAPFAPRPFLGPYVLLSCLVRMSGEGRGGIFGARERKKKREGGYRVGGR